MIPERSERVDDAERDARILARAQARAKSAWARAQQEDDLTSRAASEERLIAAWPRPRVLPARAFALGAAAAACLAALGFVALRGTPAPAVPVASTSVTSPPPATTAPPAVTAESLPSARAVVFAGACPECRVDGAGVEPGVPVTIGKSVSVPRGARLTLGFALPGALMDPLVGVDLEGPAAAIAADEHSITLERGSARFRGLRDVTLSVPGARMVGEGATFTVSIDGRGVSHVSVEKGRLVVTSLATEQARTLETGGALEIGAAEEPVARAPAAAAPATPSPAATNEATDAVASARALFHDGERGLARAQLTALARSPDVSVARRASFTLAEIEMADGQREKGRERLLALATCPDVRLAADASTLLARTEPTAAARAETWARYLATSPPAGYRERALLERAEALFDAGRPRDANEILSELRTLPLSDAHKRQLERLTYKTRNVR
ncbi:MAG TPA: hypothetical protein VLT33_18895 [Labilithrix sp.]|nr:hypothetical protein [Labilithrix sp.]